MVRSYTTVYLLPLLAVGCCFSFFACPAKPTPCSKKGCNIISHLSSSGCSRVDCLLNMMHQKKREPPLLCSMCTPWWVWITIVYHRRQEQRT